MMRKSHRDEVADGFSGVRAKHGSSRPTNGAADAGSVAKRGIELNNESGGPRRHFEYLQGVTGSGCEK